MDEIRKKILEFEQSLRKPSDVFRKKILKSPLLIVVSGICSGILLFDKTETLFPASIIIVLSVIAFVISKIYKKSSTVSSFTFIVIFYFMISCFAGFARFAISQYITSSNIYANIGDYSVNSVITGKIISQPKQRLYPNWHFNNFSFSDSGMSFQMSVDSMLIDDIEKPVSGKITVLTYEPALNLSHNQKIKIKCKLQKIQRAYNPAQFDYQSYMKRSFNIRLAATVKKTADITILEKQPYSFTNYCISLIKLTAETLLTPDENSDENALTDALLLGNRTNVSAETNLAFQRTGLLHIVSLSGLHLAFLIAFLWKLLNPFGLHYKTKAICCIVFIILFLVAVPPQAPIIRSAIVAFFFLISIIINKNTSSLNSLSLAAIMLLLISPSQLFNIGFELSFVCVFGILIFSQPIKDFIYSAIEKRASIRHSYIRGFIAEILSLTAAGLSAWVASAGIIAYNFYTVNLLSVLWTIIVSPFISLILGFGFLKIFITAAIPTMGVILGHILKALCYCVTLVVEFLSNYSSGELIIGKVAVILIILYYLLVISIANIGFFGRYKKLILGGLSLAVIFGFSLQIFANKYNGGLKMSCLSVGAGQCLIIQTPNNNFVFDIGSMSVSDVGNRVVNPYLAYSAINKIDALFISHTDIDHINGVVEVITRRKKTKIYSDDFYKADNAGFSSVGQLKKWFIDNNIRFFANNESNFRPEIQIIWPLKNDIDNNLLSDNDLSAVYLIEFADRKILLCSDIEKVGQKRLLELYPNLKADIVISPHHGSITTLDRNFLTAINPSVVLTSCSHSQYQRIIAKQPPLANNYYTAKQGCLEVYISKKSEITVKSFD